MSPSSRHGERAASRVPSTMCARARLRREPAGGALALAEVAVGRDEATPGKALAHVLLELRREPDLRHQEERLPARARAPRR